MFVGFGMFGWYIDEIDVYNGFVVFMFFDFINDYLGIFLFCCCIKCLGLFNLYCKGIGVLGRCISKICELSCGEKGEEFVYRKYLV